MKYFVLLLIVASFVTAQPTINGIGSDADYVSIATWTQGNTGFGDHGIKEMKGYNDGTKLYIMVVGEIENNFNELYIFINHSNASDGLASGNQLPAGSDGSSPFNSFRPTLDFEVDYGIRMSSGNGPANAYTSIINYRASGNTDTYIGGPANDGTVNTVSSGAYNGVQFAYKHMGAMSSVTNEGFEISIPLSVIGATGASTFELFALYGADSYISANTLPEIAGQSGTSLANNPNFASIGADQHTTASPLPVELTSFTAIAKGRGVELAWKTATELNNKGFEIERSSSANGWQNIGFVAGNGTTNAPKSYSFVDNSASGAVSYRLKQVDNDGSFEYSSAVEVTVAAPASYTLSQNHPNPFNPATTISYSLPSAGFVTLKVYDVLGKEVAVLVHELQNAGANKASFDASHLPSGIYFARLSSGSFNSVIKMTLMK